MRFQNGHWMMRKGVSALYATELYEVSIHNDTAELLAPAASVTYRAATMLPALNVTLSAPMEGVIRVTATHHKGKPTRPPFPALREEPVAPVIVDTDDQFSFASGQLRATILKAKRAWGITFDVDGKYLTRTGEKSLAYMTLDKGERNLSDAMDVPFGETFMTESIDLSVGENVYGLGERFGAYVKNGQSIDIWNADGGTCSDQAYKNIPFYMTNRGYGVLVESLSDVGFEVATENVERVQFAVRGETIRYLIISGPSPKDILRRYTALTGRPALPPAWSMGLWLSTSFTTNYDEKTVVDTLLGGMAARDIPVHVFHYDCFWMRGFHWCDFEWDKSSFPDPKGMLSRLKARGLHICVWINPYIAQNSKLFDEGMARGYLLRNEDGSVYQTDLWQAGLGLVDFTNPVAVMWYQDKLRALLKWGVDCFKTDFGERVPVRGVRWSDGSDPVAMHNQYTQLYNKAVYDVLVSERGEGDAVLFARSATIGGQTMPAHWSGDCLASFVSMAETLRGGLSLAHCGFGFWSHDISGFEQTAPANLYKRWCAFGLLSSHSRLHGSDSYRVPWLFDEEACDVLREFTRLKCRLMPYLYQKAVESHESGAPVLRPMLLEFLGDPAVDTLDRQYMLGDKLLVAPVMSESGQVDYYLPSGTWTHLIDGRVVQGGAWRRETYDFHSLPLFVRQNTLLPTSLDGIPDGDYAANLTLTAYFIEDGASETIRIPDTKGHTAATATYRRNGRDCVVRCTCSATLVLPDATLPLAPDTDTHFDARTFGE